MSTYKTQLSVDEPSKYVKLIQGNTAKFVFSYYNKSYNFDDIVQIKFLFNQGNKLYPSTGYPYRLYVDSTAEEKELEPYIEVNTAKKLIILTLDSDATSEFEQTQKYGLLHFEVDVNYIKDDSVITEINQHKPLMVIGSSYNLTPVTPDTSPIVSTILLCSEDLNCNI